MNNSCPRCHTQAVVTLCGGGTHCLACGYGEENEVCLYADIMAAIPGAPTLTRVDRYEDETYRRNHRPSDFQLAEEAATRHGVSLEQIQVKLHWKATHPTIRFALQSVIADLTISDVSIHRIASVLHKHNRTISKSPGLARGRAMKRRNHD